MSSNSITRFISTAKDLSDLLYIETFFERHSLTPLSLEKCIVNDLERLFDSVLNTPIPNNDHMKGLLGLIKCMRQISLCKDDDQWLILQECFTTLINKCTRFIMTHLDVDNILFNEILQLILQIIINSSRHHISIKNKMLQCLSPLIFDIIINKKTPLALEKLCIQSLTVLVTRTDQERRKEVMDLVYPKLAKFFDHLYSCGDYDTQLCIVEAILRYIVPDKNRKMFFVNFKHKNPNVIRNFLNVRSKDFDTDCRVFLNYVNKSQGENALVISLPCYTVLLDETVIEKPPEQELFWIDFNRGARSVSLWCNKNSLLTPEESAIPDFASSTDWQLLTIKPEVVTEVKVKSIKPCEEVQRNFKEVQFIINGPLEIRPLEEIICTQSKSVRILFPRSKETEGLEQKVLPTIFKMRKLDRIYSENKVNGDLAGNKKNIPSVKVHPVGMMDSTSCNNISKMSSKEQELKETDRSIIKEKSKLLASDRKISATKTKIEFQSFLDSDEEKENAPRNTSTKQILEISDKALTKNHGEAWHSERVDKAKSSTAGKSFLDKISLNQKENNEEDARNQNFEENQKIMKPKIDVCLNPTKLKIRNVKISTTVDRCNFLLCNSENSYSTNVHSGKETFNSNNNFTIGESILEIHGSTKGISGISRKSLSKQEPRTEAANEKMNQSLNANYVENLSNKEMRESRAQYKSHKENVKVFRRINTCQLNVPGNKIDFGSSNQNLYSPLSKKNMKEIDVSTATGTQNRCKERRPIKISTSTEKCMFNLKKAEKNCIIPQSLNNFTPNKSIKGNNLLLSNGTENQQTFKQGCNNKIGDVNEFLNKSKYSENNDKKTRKVSNSLHICLFESAEKNKRIQESHPTEDALNHADHLADEISTDKMMSKVNTNVENIDKSKSKEAKKITYGDLNLKFPNSEKKMETNSSPINKMSGDKKCTRTDEVMPHTINEKINIKETSETTHLATDSSKELLNSKITETDTDLLPSIKNRGFTAYECSQKHPLQINRANQINNERTTESSRKQSQFNLEKGKSNFTTTTTTRRSKRIQNARRQSKTVFETSASKASIQIEEKNNSDYDLNEKENFKNTCKKRLQMIKKENERKDLVNAPSNPDRMRQKITDLEITNEVKSGDMCFKRKLRKDKADCGINKIQNTHVKLLNNRNEIGENLRKSPEDKRVENKSVSKLENNKQESNCKLLITETPSSVYLENCADLSSEETSNTVKTSKQFLMNEIMSVNENHNHIPEEVKLATEDTESKPSSLKNLKKTAELCNAEVCGSLLQTCSSGTEVTEGAKVNRQNLVHNSSPEKNDNINNKTNLQERDCVNNLSNELRHEECVNLSKDFKERYTKNFGSASESAINIESESQGLFVQNEIEGNPNRENEVHNSTNTKECVTKKGIAQLSPCSQSDVSHIVTNAIVHVSSESSSPRDNQRIVKSGVDTVITQSVKVFKFFSQNITSVENKLNDSLNFQNENKSNSAKQIVNTLVKDSVEEMYIEETVTSKRLTIDTDNCKKRNDISEAAETHCEGSNKQNKVMINKGIRASTKKRKTINSETNYSSRKKYSQRSVSQSDIKSNTSRSLRKRKAVSYNYNSPIYSDEENKGKHEVNNCSRKKVGRSSVKKKLFTQNEVDILSLCSGSQVSCSTEKDTQEEIPVDTKNCNPSKSKNKIHDEFDKLLSTSPPPLPKRNPNHWEEKYKKDIQRKSLKQTSSIQKIVNSKKTKHSVYSDIDSSSDEPVCFNKEEHERKSTAAEDTEKTNFVSLIKTENTNSETNSKSKDLHYDEENAVSHLNPNNSTDTLETNKATTQLSPKVLLNKLPSSVGKERNSKVNSKSLHKSEDEVIMEKENQRLQDGKLFVKNIIMDGESEKVKKRHSKGQIQSGNNGENTEIGCNSKNKTVEQIIQQSNCDKLVSMMSAYDDKRIITQSEKSINNDVLCSEQLQQLNVNGSLKKKDFSPDNVSENEMNEASSASHNEETLLCCAVMKPHSYKAENMKSNTSIDKSKQKVSCKKKRKLIAYSDSDSDCDASICATNAEYQNKETCTVNQEIKKSNEYFTEHQNKRLVTNAVNRDTTRNVYLHFNPNNSMVRLQTNKSTTQEAIINQPEILVNSDEYSKLLQHKRGNNCIATEHVTQDIGCNDEMSKFAEYQNNDMQLQHGKEIIKFSSVRVKTQCHGQAKCIEDKTKDNNKKSIQLGSKGKNKQIGNSENEDFLAFHCNGNFTNKSPFLETKSITLNKIDDMTICKEKELQRSLIHSMNEKEKCHEMNDEYISDTETVKDKRMIGYTPLKCNEKFENKRKEHNKIKKIMKNTEISPLFLKNRHEYNTSLNNSNYNSETLINKEYVREMDTQIHHKKSIKKVVMNCSKENDRSGNAFNDSITITRDNRSIHNTKQTQLIQGDSVSCDEELSGSQEEVSSHIYEDFHKLQQNCQMELNDKLNIDDDDGNVLPEENRFSNQKTCIRAASSIKSSKRVKRHSEGQIQSKKFTSQLRYRMHQNQKTGHHILQNPLVHKWRSETDGSSLSSTETIDEYSEEQSTSVKKIKKRNPKTSLKKEIQKSIHGKRKYLKEFSRNISNTILGYFSQSSCSFHARRTDSRKYIDNNIQHKIEKIKNSIQTLDGFIEVMEERIEEVNKMIIDQNSIEEDIKQNFIHIENEYKKFATELSNEPKFDIQQLISSLGDKFRKETLRNMLQKLHNVCDISL